MKRSVLAIALACALSGTVLAGHIPTSDAPQPPPPPDPVVASTPISTVAVASDEDDDSTLSATQSYGLTVILTILGIAAY